MEGKYAWININSQSLLRRMLVFPSSQHWRRIHGWDVLPTYGRLAGTLQLPISQATTVRQAIEVWKTAREIAG